MLEVDKKENGHRESNASSKKLLSPEQEDLWSNIHAIESEMAEDEKLERKSGIGGYDGGATNNSKNGNYFNTLGRKQVDNGA